MIKFFGQSDDLVEIEGCAGGDQEHDHFTPESYVPAVFDVGGKLAVTAMFTDDGTWTFGYVTYLRDGVDAPSGLDCRLPRSPWPIIIKPRSEVRGYSQELVIEAPEGTEVRRIK